MDSIKGHQQSGSNFFKAILDQKKKGPRGSPVKSLHFQGDTSSSGLDSVPDVDQLSQTSSDESSMLKSSTAGSPVKQCKGGRVVAQPEDARQNRKDHAIPTGPPLESKLPEKMKDPSSSSGQLVMVESSEISSRQNQGGSQGEDLFKTELDLSQIDTSKLQQDQSRLEAKYKPKRHVVKREDGSILIINFEQFHQLINEPEQLEDGDSESSDESSSSSESSYSSSSSEILRHIDQPEQIRQPTTSSLGLKGHFQGAQNQEEDFTAIVMNNDADISNNHIQSFEQLISNLNSIPEDQNLLLTDRTSRPQRPFGEAVVGQHEQHHQWQANQECDMEGSPPEEEYVQTSGRDLMTPREMMNLASAREEVASHNDYCSVETFGQFVLKPGETLAKLKTTAKKEREAALIPSEKKKKRHRKKKRPILEKQFTIQSSSGEEDSRLATRSNKSRQEKAETSRDRESKKKLATNDGKHKRQKSVTFHQSTAPTAHFGESSKPSNTSHLESSGMDSCQEVSEDIESDRALMNEHGIWHPEDLEAHPLISTSKEGLSEEYSEDEEAVEVNGILFLGTSKTLSFEEAVNLYTVNSDRWPLFSTLFQSLTFVFASLGILASAPVIFGLHFLTYIPKSFECFKEDPASSEDFSLSWLADDKWNSCSIQEICSPSGPYLTNRNFVRPAATEVNQIENWSEKLALVCQGAPIGFDFKVKLAMIFAMIGSLLFLPSLSDKHGRKSIFCFSLVVQIITNLLLLLNENAWVQLGLVALLGASWPGTTLVGLLYILDFYPCTYHRYQVFKFLLTIIVVVGFVPFYYEHISRNWQEIQIVCLIVQLVSFCFCILLLPESIWSLFAKGDFGKSRTMMEGILRFNGCGLVKLMFRFERETESQFNQAMYLASRETERLTMHPSASSVDSRTPVDGAALGIFGGDFNRHSVARPSIFSPELNAPNAQASFVSILLRLSLLLCCTVIGFFLLQVGIRLPVGSISIFKRASFFLMGDLLGSVIGGILIIQLGMKTSIMLTQAAFFACSMLLLVLSVQAKSLPGWIFSLISYKAQANPGNLQLCLFITNLVAFASLTVQFIGMLTSPEVFPRIVRTSCIGFALLMALISLALGESLVFYKQLLPTSGSGALATLAVALGGFMISINLRLPESSLPSKLRSKQNMKIGRNTMKGLVNQPYSSNSNEPRK